MRDFLSTGPGQLTQLLFLMFYWVPFALAAYLSEHWNSELAHRSLERLIHPFRHIEPHRPAATGTT